MKFNLACPACFTEMAVNHQVGMTAVDCPKCGASVAVPDSPGRAGEGDAFSPIAFGAALGAGVLGAAAWAGLSIFANFEVGYLAWGIGALVGIAAVRLGGRGKPMAVAAAVISLCSIFGGKFIAMQAIINEEISETTAEPEYFSYVDSMRKDSMALSRLGADPTDDQLRQMLNDRQLMGAPPIEFTPQDIADFREYQVPEIEAFGASQPSQEEWSANKRAQIESYVQASGGITGFVREDLGPIDLLFLFLGLSTAFGLVSKAD